MPICISMCNTHVTGVCAMQDLITGNKAIRHIQQFTGQTINLDLNRYIQERPR